VLSRLHAIVVVMFLVVMLGALPGLSPAAHAESRTVTVATYPLDPFVMTRDGVRTGFTIDLLNQIATRAGWTLKFDEIANGSSKGLLKEVIEGRADAAACSISITAERLKTADFSQPFLSGGLQILVPADTVERSQPGLKGFLKLLLSKAILVWFFVALILAAVPAHIIWLLERHHDDSMVARSYFPGIFQSLGWGLGMLTASADQSPRHWAPRMVGVVWAFVSLIFVSYFTAILTANLTAEKFESKIGGPADLIGKKVCAVAKSTSSEFLTSIGVPHQTPANLPDCYAGLGGKYDAVVDASPILRYYANNGGAGKVEVVGPVFKERDYGVGFAIGSDLRKQFDDALLQMREDGEYDALREKWLGKPDRH
jgi:polar amino acid transport system substrate-binding protein